jgi:hypothetical protein
MSEVISIDKYKIECFLDQIYDLVKSLVIDKNIAIEIVSNLADTDLEDASSWLELIVFSYISKINDLSLDNRLNITYNRNDGYENMLCLAKGGV